MGTNTVPKNVHLPISRIIFQAKHLFSFFRWAYMYISLFIYLLLLSTSYKKEINFTSHWVCLVNERETGNVASAAPHMYPDGLCESLPRPRAAFIKELRALPQSDSLQFLKYITSHSHGGLLCLIVLRKTDISFKVLSGENCMSGEHESHEPQCNHEITFCAVALCCVGMDNMKKRRKISQLSYFSCRCWHLKDCGRWWLCDVSKAKSLQPC